MPRNVMKEKLGMNDSKRPTAAGESKESGTYKSKMADKPWKHSDWSGKESRGKSSDA